MSRRPDPRTRETPTQGRGSREVRDSAGTKSPPPVPIVEHPQPHDRGPCAGRWLVNTGATTAYDRIITSLEGHGSRGRVNGTKAASAQCPGHDDSSPSLSLRSVDGSVLVYCHAGCHVEDVLAALNLGLADLYDGEKPAGCTFTARTLTQITVGGTPPEPPNPLGDPDHFCDRILQQERLERDPAYQRRRSDELAAVKARPGEYMGGPVPWDRGAS
jgi:hypothetical protein